MCDHVWFEDSHLVCLGVVFGKSLEVGAMPPSFVLLLALAGCALSLIVVSPLRPQSSMVALRATAVPHMRAAATRLDDLTVYELKAVYAATAVEVMHVASTARPCPSPCRHHDKSGMRSSVPVPQMQSERPQGEWTEGRADCARGRCTAGCGDCGGGRPWSRPRSRSRPRPRSRSWWPRPRADGCITIGAAGRATAAATI